MNNYDSIKFKDLKPYWGSIKGIPLITNGVNMEDLMYKLDKVVDYMKRKDLPYLKMEDLEAGYLYDIHARNAFMGIWVPQNKSFLISRFKFHNNFIFEEYHVDYGGMFPTAKPLKKIEKAPFNVDKLSSSNIIIQKNTVVQTDTKDKIIEKKLNYPDYYTEEELLAYLNKRAVEYIGSYV